MPNSDTNLTQARAELVNASGALGKLAAAHKIMALRSAPAATQDADPVTQSQPTAAPAPEVAPPVAAPEMQPAPADPARAEAVAYLQSVIESRVDLADEAIASRMEELYGQFEGDAEIVRMLEEASEVYVNAATESAKRAL